MLRDSQDAYGLELDNYAQGKGNSEIVERDDGYLDASIGPAAYFSASSDWPLHQQNALKLANGRVLDIGCGAGRHALYLQERGLDVLGYLFVSKLELQGLIAGTGWHVARYFDGLGAN